MCGLTNNLTNKTIKVDLRISFLFLEKSANNEINNTAALLIKIPRKGTEIACNIPPNADSLNAHSAVIFKTEILLSETSTLKYFSGLEFKTIFQVYLSTILFHPRDVEQN